jgi:HD-GYP domain-containing protein (c-di-GMP phosphodiesterase class II)
MNDFTKSNNLTPETMPFSQDAHLNSLLVSLVNDVKGYADRMISQVKQLTNIGRALSGEKNLNALLEMIVDQARSFANADAGTLYILEKNILRFKIVQTESLNIRMGGRFGDKIPFPPIELKESNVSAYVAMNGVPVNIPDVYHSDLFDFTGPKKFDQTSGYRSKSMLVVPMRNHENDVIGVLQLLNAQNPLNGEVIPFSPDLEGLTESLASQAAVAITNVKLILDMEQLFEAFVEVMATAIDEKSPITGGHIKRVANMTITMAEILNETKTGPYKDVYFSNDQLYELKIAAWMHDIGKVTTPVEIIEKGKKLQTIFDRVHYVNLRFCYLIQKLKKELLENKVSLLESGTSSEDIAKADEEGKAKIQELEDLKAFVIKCNEPGEFLEADKLEKLKEISEMTYIDEKEETVPYLTENELENLSIRKGSITEKERKIMQHHATITLKMLNRIPFTKKLKNIPNFAGAHHEFLNGKGYPLGLKGDEIPFEGLIMAVTDIAEALTASDRPYKKAMPLSNVYRILKSMSEHEELHKGLVDFFIEEKVYERYKEKYE